MSDKIKVPSVIALGYFDSVHLGHKKVIESAIDIAKEYGAQTVVFTFKGNLKAAVGGGDEKAVFSAKEREQFIKELGVDEIYFAPVDLNFLSMGKLAFLNLLNRKYDIKCYVSGNDYRFGRFGQGSVQDIIRYAKKNGQDYKIVETFNLDAEKVSTTAVKKLLDEGNVKGVNALLGRAYSISGAVFEDRGVGHKIGFPTVNVKIDKDKHRLKDGVYAGRISLDGKIYKTIINYGARPTFDLSEKLLEAHIIDFCGELYGKEITLQFDGFIRDIKKFDDQEQLKSQLEKDLAEVKEGKYD